MSGSWGQAGEGELSGGSFAVYDALRLAIEVLKEANIEGAARLLRVSWDEAWNLMERAVRRGQRRKKRRVVKKMGVDEKSLGQGHNYLTLVYDLGEARVEYIADDRRKESLDGYFSLLSLAQREEIEAIATDIWDPYLASIREHVPGAEEKLVFDRGGDRRNQLHYPDHQENGLRFS